MTTCFAMEVTPGCLTTAAGTKETVSIHYEYRASAAGNPVIHAVRYTNAAGTPIILAVGDTVIPGACPVSPPDVEWERLCDVSVAGVVTEFFRRSITVWDAAGVPTVTVTDWQLDKVTAYAPAGTVTECNLDCDVVAPVGLVTTWG
jgi:hypothetical protein